MVTWQFDEAAEKLDEILDRAFDEGPQEIVFGDTSVFVLTEGEYLEMLAKRKQLDDSGLVGREPEQTASD